MLLPWLYFAALPLDERAARCGNQNCTQTRILGTPSESSVGSASLPSRMLSACCSRSLARSYQQHMQARSSFGLFVSSCQHLAGWTPAACIIAASAWMVGARTVGPGACHHHRLCVLPSSVSSLIFSVSCFASYLLPLRSLFISFLHFPSHF